eukprot:scaffold1173_cov405-Prasinococcus_capsulatus_cf.AAC.2
MDTVSWPRGLRPTTVVSRSGGYVTSDIAEAGAGPQKLRLGDYNTRSGNPRIQTLRESKMTEYSRPVRNRRRPTCIRRLAKLHPRFLALGSPLSSCLHFCNLLCNIYERTVGLISNQGLHVLHGCHVKANNGTKGMQRISQLHL